MVVDVVAAAAAAELVADDDDDVDVEDDYADGVAGTDAALVVAAAVVADLDSSCWFVGGRVLEALSARDTEVSC